MLKRIQEIWVVIPESPAKPGSAARTPTVTKTKAKDSVSRMFLGSFPMAVRKSLFRFSDREGIPVRGRQDFNFVAHRDIIVDKRIVVDMKLNRFVA